MAKSYLDSDGVLYLWQKIKSYVAGKTPTKTSDLTNDSGFITSGDIPEGSAASTTTPKMDGTAAVGTEMAFARGDHVHPKDTSKANLASPTFTGTPKAPTAAKGTNSTQIATTAYVQTALGDKQNTLTFDTAPTASSTNPVTSGGVYTAIAGKIDSAAKGSANGVCPLDANSKVDASYLPSYVDDVQEVYAKIASGTLSLYASATATTAITAEKGKIYIVVGGNSGYDASSITDNQYRWSGTQYVKLADGGVSSITNTELDTICVE